MTGITAWVEQATWPAVIAATARLAESVTDPDIALVYAADDDARAVAGGSVRGLLGRRRNDDRVHAATQAAAEVVLADALATLARPAAVRVVHGRPERAVLAALDGMDWLVLARDGDLTRLGPHSLGPHTRFVLDHAPCDVVLVWPDSAPGIDTAPPPPPPGAP